MTGGKCAETEKSPKSQVEESVLNCGARMTSGENGGKEDENVKMSLSWGLIWKVFSVYWRLKIRAVHLFRNSSFLYLLLTWRDLLFYHECDGYVRETFVAAEQPFSAVCVRFIWPISADVLCPEQSPIFQATVLRIATSRINIRRNGLFYTWNINVYDVGLIGSVRWQWSSTSCTVKCSVL